MPKFSLDINGIGKGAAEERKSWAGGLPPTGSYDGVLEILSLGTISQKAKKPENRGKPVLKIGVKLVNTPGGEYDGYIAWSRQNLLEGSEPYVNQFLHSLTNGTQTEKDEIERAFYGDGLIVSENRQHIVRIGDWKIESPKGKLPIKVAVRKRNNFNEETKQTTEISEIESFLMGGNASARRGGSAPETIVEEETSSIDLDDEDENETGYDPDSQDEADSEGDAIDADEMFEDSTA